MVRKSIICYYCSYSACSTCIKLYLLDSFHQPHCMNCRKEWSSTFLAEHLYFFMKTEYRHKKEILLFEKQKSLIPALLPVAEQERKIQNVSRYITMIQDEIVSWYKKVNSSEITYEEWKKEKRDLRRTLRALLNERNQLTALDHKEERKTFIMRCTMEDCRGFLSVRYKCGLCSTQVCPQCHEVNIQDHTCNADTVATIIELKKTTKSCPSCQTLIYKTEGCDQMWCIQCHTAFSWKTGLEEKGIIHNPHYFDYLKGKGNVPRNPLDIPCGGLPHFNNLYAYTMDNQLVPDEVVYLRRMYEILTHFRQVTLAQELPNPQQPISYRDLLLSYILQQMTEKHFKAQLYVKEQKRERGLEERQIIEAYVTIGEEAFRKLVQNACTFDEFIYEMEHCKDYARTELHKLNDRYEHKGYLHYDWLEL